MPITVGLEGSWYITSCTLEWSTILLHSYQGPNVTMTYLVRCVSDLKSGYLLSV